MADFSANGLTLRWTNAVQEASGDMQRVLVEGGPMNPANAMRIIYSLGGGPERVTRGWPVGTNPDTGLQAFAADLPAASDDAPLAWRPVLTQGWREADPGKANAGLIEILPISPKPQEADMHTDIVPDRTPDVSGIADVADAAPAATLPELLQQGLPDILPEPAATLNESPTPQPPDSTVTTPGAFPYRLVHLARVTVPLEDPPIVVGATPDGLRIIYPLGRGGTVDGPHMKGVVEHVGGDWMRVREDGVGIVDLRALVTTSDGAKIMAEYSGVADFGVNGHAALLAGKPPAAIEINMAPRFLTANPRWAWINRLQLAAFGRVTMDTLLVQYDLYAMQSEAVGGGGPNHG